jgi:hypothetical protein
MFYLRYLCLFVGGRMLYLRYLCLFAQSGVQLILCCTDNVNKACVLLQIAAGKDEPNIVFNNLPGSIVIFSI